MCMLPFSWCLLRRSDQVIPRIIKLEHCTVRDEINITKSSPLADESTVPEKSRFLRQLATQATTSSLRLHENFVNEDKSLLNVESV